MRRGYMESRSESISINNNNNNNGGGGDLNPEAKEWNPVYDCAAEEDRCIFLTFSNGYPLSELQIINFFTRKFGACIERVYVHHRKGRNQPPLFGKVVFYASSFPAIIMDGKEEVKFCIDNRTMWCKRYEARKARLFRVLGASGGSP